MLRKEGIMLVIKDDEIKMFMRFVDDRTVQDCVNFRENYHEDYDDFIMLLFKTDDKILQDYVTYRMVRKQEELTKELIYETFNMDLKVRGLEKYVMNKLFKNVRY